MALQRGHQGVADLVVGHNLFLFGRDHGVLALGTGNHRLHAFLQIGLGHLLAAQPYGPQGGFVYNVGQFGAGSARRARASISQSTGS